MTAFLLLCLSTAAGAAAELSFPAATPQSHFDLSGGATFSCVVQAVPTLVFMRRPSQNCGRAALLCSFCAQRASLLGRGGVGGGDFLHNVV